MRLSVNRDDPCYDPDKGRKATVLFNGVVQDSKATGRLILTADEEKGEIVFHNMDESGHIEIDYAKDEFATYTERGRVSILFLDNA